MRTKRKEQFYTLCFCIKEGQVLMIYRNKEPYKHNWNGIGGKIEKEESPLEAIYREVWEEASIDLNRANSLKYRGILSRKDRNSEGYVRIYTFIAHIDSIDIENNNPDTKEGTLAMKNLKWVCNKKNSNIVCEIPYFLPHMLAEENIYHYYCEYENEKFRKINICPLLEDYLGIHKKLRFPRHAM
ncbi:NUDIX domain-containing protein [Candidatus Roizmanbacteria bacterium]|nr:NUDIX domain-containing protein [Candidatus Roizmanbacteria bacterium]